MQRRGLVIRVPCDDDGRGVLARVTDEGLGALREHADVHVTGVREHLFDQMDVAEVEALGRVLGKVAAHLRDVRGAGGDRRARLGA